MRFKNRYLLLELVWKDARMDNVLLEPALLARFRESLAANFGDHGVGLALQSLQVKYYYALTGLCIVRCSREQHRQVSVRQAGCAAILQLNFGAGVDWLNTYACHPSL